MTDDDTPPADDAPPPTNDPAPEPDKGEDPELVKWKALARKHENTARANAAAARKLQEIEDANKSDTQRLTDDANKHKSRADTAEASLLKLQVALDKAPEGMPMKRVRALAGRLQGATVEEMEADAAELFADFAPTVPADDKPEPPKVRGRPREQYRGGGGDPNEEPEETDPAKLAAMVPRAR
jgi:hypothetical protein